MADRRFGVGIVGLQPGRSWAARAHVPALRALPDDFEIVGIANTSRASAEAAAAACDIPRAFADVAELVAAPEVEIVAVTVKVPHHLAIVKGAVAAGKHVYCEWPLGNGLAEAEELAALVKARGVRGVIGTQARASAAIAHLRDLVAGGFVGEVLSTTLVARGGAWGPAIPSTAAYMLDRTNGATMLTIPVGHALAAIRDVLGEIVEVSALLANRRPAVRATDTGGMLAMTADDEVLVNGLLGNGAPLSLHYRGGPARDGKGLLWEINGTEGEIQVTGISGHVQMVPLTIRGARRTETELQVLEPPETLLAGWPEDVVPGNVARNYARLAADLREGTATAPSFDDAVALHRIIAAIEAAAESGTRVRPGN